MKSQARKFEEHAGLGLHDLESNARLESSRTALRIYRAIWRDVSSYGNNYGGRTTSYRSFHTSPIPVNNSDPMEIENLQRANNLTERQQHQVHLDLRTNACRRFQRKGFPSWKFDRRDAESNNFKTLDREEFIPIDTKLDLDTGSGEV